MNKVFRYLLCFSLLIMLTACGAKKEVSPDEFTNKLAKEGFRTNDVTDQMEDSNVTAVKTANNGKYQIEYYYFKTEDAAKKAYQNNKELFESNKDSKGKEKKKDTYEKYTQETDEVYNYLMRVENTLIYATVNPEFKNDLERQIGKIGY